MSLNKFPNIIRELPYFFNSWIANVQHEFIAGSVKMRSLDRSLGCKHYANELRSLATFKLLSMFFKAPWTRIRPS